MAEKASSSFNAATDDITQSSPSETQGLNTLLETLIISHSELKQKEEELQQLRLELARYRQANHDEDEFDTFSEITSVSSIGEEKTRRKSILSSKRRQTDIASEDAAEEVERVQQSKQRNNEQFSAHSESEDSGNDVSDHQKNEGRTHTSRQSTSKKLVRLEHQLEIFRDRLRRAIQGYRKYKSAFSTAIDKKVKAEQLAKQLEHRISAVEYENNAMKNEIDRMRRRLANAEEQKRALAERARLLLKKESEMQNKMFLLDSERSLLSDEVESMLSTSTNFQRLLDTSAAQLSTAMKEVEITKERLRIVEEERDLLQQCVDDIFEKVKSEAREDEDREGSSRTSAAIAESAVAVVKTFQEKIRTLQSQLSEAQARLKEKDLYIQRLTEELEARKSSQEVDPTELGGSWSRTKNAQSLK